MRINTFFYTIRQGIRNIARNKLFSLASIATIGACLFLFGIFYAVLFNFQNIVRSAQEGVSVTIFFQQGTSEARMQEIGDQISKRVEVSKVEFVSADEAWEGFRDEYLGEYADGYSENPLIDSANYQIYLSDVSMQPALVTYLESMQEIRKVNRSELAAATLSGVNALIAYATAGIIGILFAVSIFLISNTVAIGISVRKEEINIMKYIGATDFFVRSPFVIEGILIGIVGSAIPLILVYMLYNRVIEYIVGNFATLSQLLAFLPVEELFRTLVPVSIAMGAGIGFLGSITTVRKHLRV